ncbi:MAG: potassium transporter TrkG [Lachnospiraceae bacterium]|nr:potassium transporter TrkG [Lachnospiraceae bacterium]
MKENKVKNFSTTKLIAGSFLAAILAGTLLLMMPFSSADGTFTNPVDALFTATTSICVTGLVTVVTAFHWSAVGKLIIMCLAQLGGLGVITVITMLFILMGKQITLKERMLVSEAYNLGELKGMVVLVRRIVSGTLVVEIIGFLLYSVVFVPEYGMQKGIFCALFNSVSAFCNAGMDILGDESLIPYAVNPLINFTTITLIVLGGLGFPVWWDVLDSLKKRKSRGFSWRKMAQKLQLHTKIVFCATAVLIFIPALLFLLLEYHNPDTIGNFSFFGKIQASLFQSVTTRTAGFASVDQGKLTNASALLTMILMFVGGSPAGTAGGMKTTTIAILLGTVLCMAKGQNSTSMFHRRLTVDNVRSALCVVMLGLVTSLVACMGLMALEDAAFADVMFEVISALGTAGLSRGITGELCAASKLILIVTMYIGRIGPITLVVAILRKGRKNNLKYNLPQGNVIVG